MTKVKGIKKLNSSMTKVFKPFGIKKVWCGKEYEYNRVHKTIQFKLTEDTLEDVWFKEFISDFFKYNVEIPFMISMLHEVGHYKTDNDIDDEIYLKGIATKERIEEEMQLATDYDECKKLEFEYFGIPEEFLATQWAVQYAKTHPKKVKQMWNKCYKALYRFYKINGIFEENA